MPALSEEILATLKQEAARYNKPENQINYQRFFKERLDNPVGLRTPVLRKIFSSCYKRYQHYSAREILDACERLLASNERYVNSLAFEWSLRLSADFNSKDIDRFEFWLKNYVHDWAACDSLSCGPLGLFVRKFPESVSRTYQWTKSKNRWLRRASAVCLIQSLRKGLLLEEAFKTADALLLDDDDMVQKGFGWMLKVASKPFPEEIYKFINVRKGRMPRTALRYAIEKFPANQRRQLMK
jgi:3-methyladenine DNA glycosylase AlkD